jgi:dihydropteroate synthase
LGTPKCPRKKKSGVFWPIIKKLATGTDVLISIDTMKASVAEAALQAGAHILNDVWGLQRDEKKWHMGRQNTMCRLW